MRKGFIRIAWFLSVLFALSYWFLLFINPVYWDVIRHEDKNCITFITWLDCEFYDKDCINFEGTEWISDLKNNSKTSIESNKDKWRRETDLFIIIYDILIIKRQNDEDINKDKDLKQRIIRNALEEIGEIRISKALPALDMKKFERRFGVFGESHPSLLVRGEEPGILCKNTYEWWMIGLSILEGLIRFISVWVIWFLVNWLIKGFKA